jgi:hypothetical protein
MSRPGGFSGHTCIEILTSTCTRAPRGALFYLWLSINCGIEANDSIRGPNCLVPPWSRTAGRAAHTAALSFQRMDLHLTEFQWPTRSCGQKKGPGRCETNLALTTALLGRQLPSTVLKTTFAELLRSCSRNTSRACCGVTHAVGPGMRRPLSFIPDRLQVHQEGYRHPSACTVGQTLSSTQPA